ncbi:uncharacterized protein PFL1_06630 [Pseudozyma flocculosa PF-1]|uniref:Related to sugar transport protein STP1 n=2 Tax=Pseudozyma flocculosa TaxID=84751 RepID=A0A5C3F8G5_9BASI|nr:uncharacterized protein PFL1_06630 [Pseudozyma flocculosa PF-1]EPQ25763.1 hypothetical protein PFL1_06630 [Pseudozyma flocculosa PF-1]SPO40540.1 related to sugar transport protein STP1 [Pseudozyma flocculosa]
MALSPKFYTWLVGCFAAMGSMLFGYDLGVIAGVLVAPDFLKTTNNPDSDYLGFITSSMLLGAFAGSIPASIIADKYSRRSAIVAGCLVFLFGGSMQTGATGREVMLAGRFFAGFGIGMIALLVPLYQSEIAHPSIRGSLTTLQQFFLGIGALVASFVIYGCSNNYRGTEFEWRFPLALQLVPAIPLGALIFCFPESPRWLVAQGRNEEALAALARLHASGDVTDTFVVAEHAELQLKIREEVESRSAWSEIFGDVQSIRKIMIGIILQFSVQMTGVSAIQYYSPQIFSNFGFSNQRTFLFQAIASIFALVGEGLCVGFVDKVGRRWPLIICNMGTGLVFIVAAALQANYPSTPDNLNKAASYTFVAFTWLFQLFFSAGIGPLSWAVPVEILNTNIRAKGVAITNLASWISNFMIGQVTPRALASVGWRFYLLFAVCGFTNALTFFLILPETKGRTLEEMDDWFAQTPFIVILSKAKPIDTKERERQLAAGMDGPVAQRLGHNDFEKDGSEKSKTEYLDTA